MFTISDSGAAGNRQMVPGLLVLPEGNRANMNSYQQLKGNFTWFPGYKTFFTLNSTVRLSMNFQLIIITKILKNKRNHKAQS